MYSVHRDQYTTTRIVSITSHYDYITYTSSAFHNFRLIDNEVIIIKEWFIIKILTN